MINSCSQQNKLSFWILIGRSADRQGKKGDLIKSLRCVTTHEMLLLHVGKLCSLVTLNTHLLVAAKSRRKLFLTSTSVVVVVVVVVGLGW